MILYLLPILQSKLRFSGNLLGNNKQTDPKTTLFTIGGVILFILIAYLANKLSSGNGALRQHKRVFIKKAKELHLSKQQVKLLVNLLKQSDMKKPLMVLTHPSNLNSLLRKAIRDIKKESLSENVRQARITQIYRIKHHLDKYQNSSQIKSTNELKQGTKIIIERNDKKSYSSTVLGNYDNFFCIQLPIDSLGNQVKWKKGSVVKIIAFDHSEKESHFISKTLGIKNVGRTNTIIIAHTIRSSKNIARGFQRVDVSLSTYLYPVTKTYDNNRKRYILKTNKNTGRIGKVIDISSGGCAITSKVPFNEGSLIELDFDIDTKKTVTLKGKVMNVRMSRGRKIMHIKFTHASPTNLNLINNFIYSLG